MADLSSWLKDCRYISAFLRNCPHPESQIEGCAKIANTTGKLIDCVDIGAMPVKKSESWDDDDMSTWCYEFVEAGDEDATTAFLLVRGKFQLEADAKTRYRQTIMDKFCCVLLCKSGFPKQDVCGKDFDVSKLCKRAENLGARVLRTDSPELTFHG